MWWALRKDNCLTVLRIHIFNLLLNINGKSCNSRGREKDKPQQGATAQEPTLGGKGAHAEARTKAAAIATALSNPEPET